MTLRKDGDMRIGQDIAGKTGGLPSRMRRALAAEGEKFSKHLVGRVEMISAKGAIERPDAGMPLIAPVGQCNPIEGVREEASHAGRLGKP